MLMNTKLWKLVWERLLNTSMIFIEIVSWADRVFHETLRMLVYFNFKILTSGMYKIFIEIF